MASSPFLPSCMSPQPMMTPCQSLTLSGGTRMATYTASYLYTSKARCTQWAKQALASWHAGLVPVGYVKFSSSSFHLCPIGYHMGLALGPLGHEQEARPLNVAFRRDVTETTNEVGTIRCNFLKSNTNLNCALSQEWI